MLARNLKSHIHRKGKRGNRTYSITARRMISGEVFPHFLLTGKPCSFIRKLLGFMGVRIDGCVDDGIGGSQVCGPVSA